MRIILKSFWGCIPIAFSLLCIIAIATIEAVMGYTLRVVPQTILIIFVIISFGVLLLWVNVKYTKHSQKVDTTISHIIGTIIKFISLVVFSVSIVFSFIFFILGYTPEHIVIKNDIKMVAMVRSFLEEQVDYYQYKNVLFCGKLLGHENYGNGSGDPLAEEDRPDPKSWIFYDLDGNVIDSGTKSEINENHVDFKQQAKDDALLEQEEKEALLKREAEIKQFDISILENREDELVFSITIDDFIDSFNGWYWQNKGSRYLLPTKYSNWRTDIYDTAVHSKHETIYYNFTEDEKVWPLPTISVYTPSNNSYIQEITLNFDDHSYSEPMFSLYEELCFYTLKVFFPDADDEKITELYKTLNDLAYANIFSNEQGYNSNSIPCSLYYCNGIGLYPYFAVGECLHICIIPVTEEVINEYRNKGVAIYEIN